MRLNADSNLRGLITVYLNDKKESNAVEAYVPGNSLEGQGYVVRMVTNNGKATPTIMVAKPLPPMQYDSNGALCEKVLGQVRIEIADDSSQFEDN